MYTCISTDVGKIHTYFFLPLRAWILHPSQQRCGGIPPSPPPGLRNVGFRPLSSLSPGSWRRVPSRAAKRRGARARALGSLCFAARIRWRQGERRDRNALLTVKRNEKLSFFFSLFFFFFRKLRHLVENRCTVLFVRNCRSVEADEGKEWKRRTNKNRSRSGQSTERCVCSFGRESAIVSQLLKERLKH
ncbi:unnamed protein product [Sphagnum balticum]